VEKAVLGTCKSAFPIINGSMTSKSVRDSASNFFTSCSISGVGSSGRTNNPSGSVPKEWVDRTVAYLVVEDTVLSDSQHHVTKSDLAQCCASMVFELLRTCGRQLPKKSNFFEGQYATKTPCPTFGRCAAFLSIISRLLKEEGKPHQYAFVTHSLT
jgi:hypothetical protein